MWEFAREHFDYEFSMLHPNLSIQYFFIDDFELDVGDDALILLDVGAAIAVGVHQFGGLEGAESVLEVFDLTNNLAIWQILKII